MLVCPNCFMPQFCPCENCLPRHGQFMPLLWVWICGGNVAVCGWCGTQIDEEVEWDQFTDRWADQWYREGE